MPEMPGRHRDRSPSWRLPTAVAATATALLVFAVWLSGGSWTAKTDGAAVAAASAGTAKPAPPPTTTVPPTTESTTTTEPPPTTESSSTTTEPPTTTTKKKKQTPTTTAESTPPPEPEPEPEPAPAAASCGTTLDGTQSHVAQVGNHVKGKFGVDSVGGKAGRSGTSDHPSGLALDFMVDPASGDAIADYVLANSADFGVTYVIWKQRYNDGSGWSQMEDRGGATANHYDHVHVSFKSGADVSVTC